MAGDSRSGRRSRKRDVEYLLRRLDLVDVGEKSVWELHQLSPGCGWIPPVSSDGVYVRDKCRRWKVQKVKRSFLE